MINNIIKKKVPDLKDKTNTHVAGKPLEKYVPGQPLKKKVVKPKVLTAEQKISEHVSESGATIIVYQVKDVPIQLKYAAYISVIIASISVIAYAARYLLFK